MFAAVGGHTDTVEYLLSRGCNASIQVRATPEYIEQSAKDVAEGKDGAEPHKEGLSALMLAAQNGHLTCVQKILSAARTDATVAALMQQKDEDDLSALGHAVKGNFEETALYLSNQPGAQPNEYFVDKTGEQVHLLMSALNEEHGALALRLIEAGADVNAKSMVDNVTSVTQAAFLGLDDVVERLVEGGANLALKNTAGAGPLMAAAAEGYSGIAQLLVEKGVDPNDADVDIAPPH